MEVCDLQRKPFARVGSSCRLAWDAPRKNLTTTLLLFLFFSAEKHTPEVINHPTPTPYRYTHTIVYNREGARARAHNSNTALVKYARQNYFFIRDSKIVVHVTIYYYYMH
jgi:hypothetical protein